MTSGWQTRPFEECIEKVVYTSKIQRKDFLTEGAYPIVSQEEEFINGYWDDEADVFQVAAPIIVFGDHTKVLKFVDFDFVLGADGVKVLPPRDFLLPKFFFYQLQTANLDSLGYARHYKLLKELKITYPPSRAEQQRIVAILDEAFDGIATAKANAEKNLQNARALFEGHLQSIFARRGEGWINKEFGAFAEFRNGINFTKSSRGESVKVIGVKDFQNSFWAPFENLDSVTVDGALHDSDALRENDLLFVRSNGNLELIGRSLLMGAVKERVTHSGFTIRARLISEEVLPTYLCHFLKSDGTRRKMIDGGIGTNIKSLSQGTLAALVVPFPHRKEQKQIVRQLEALRAETKRLESLYQRKLAALDELRKSLLHQAFSGNL